MNVCVTDNNIYEPLLLYILGWCETTQIYCRALTILKLKTKLKLNPFVRKTMIFQLVDKTEIMMTVI